MFEVVRFRSNFSAGRGTSILSCSCKRIPKEFPGCWIGYGAHIERPPQSTPISLLVGLCTGAGIFNKPSKLATRTNHGCMRYYYTINSDKRKDVIRKYTVLLSRRWW